jgi:hypothetical protein
MIMKLKEEARAHGGCRASEKKKRCTAQKTIMLKITALEQTFC